MSCIVIQQTSYPRNKVPKNQQNFDNPRTMVLAKKNGNSSASEMYFKSECLDAFRAGFRY